MHTRIIIIFVTVFGFIVTGCSSKVPPGFPKKLKPFSVKVLHEGKPLAGTAVSLFSEGGGNFLVGSVTDADGVAAMKTSLNAYSQTGAPPGTYKCALTSGADSSLTKGEIEELKGKSKEIWSMSDDEKDQWDSEWNARRLRRLAAIPKVVPKEWQQSGTSPLKITVPAGGGTVTIEITDEKTFVQ
ncbi:MAG: DUF4198 domain-containing protein [Planctomycetaceae bacterium]|jgi:uncharacterized protein YfaS (alpha-2-macroglobulin family)|nr:DUF4198 domain-containing protein [Planctomycetaceae bacterium]